VADALYAWNQPASKTYVRIDTMEPEQIRETIEREMSIAQALKESKSGSDLLSKCATIADTMNDATINFEFYEISIQDKSGWRDTMISHVDATVNDILAPMTVQAALQALGTIDAIVGSDRELSSFCVDKASALMQDLTKTLLNLSRSGYLVPGMRAILRHIKVSLGQTAAASSRIASGLRRRLLLPQTHERIAPESVSSIRQALPGENGVKVIRNIIGLSKLSVASHAAGQATAFQETSKFIMKTDRIELADMPGLSDFLLGAPIARCADCPQIVPNLSFAFPSAPSQRRLSGLTVQSYEVQQVLAYDRVLPDSRTELLCIVKGEQTLWSSAPVLVPIDVSGNTITQSVRANIKRFGFQKCPLLSAIGILNVRFFQTDTQVEELDSSAPVRIRMSFDPLVREEIISGVADPYTGISSSASCVRWDNGERMWTTQGIRHVKTYMGDANGTGAFVECETFKLGDFAVSEVPKDCKGVVLGPAVYDQCGVCGGDDSSCSGCDGEPNSGRMKDCSGHGACGVSERCECEPGWHGIYCHVLCDNAINCSGFGECSVEFEGLSMQTKVECKCEEGYRKSSDEIDIRPVATCEQIVIEPWRLPESVFWSLVVGLPILIIACTIYCFLRYLAMKEKRFVNLMRKDVDLYTDYYMEENSPIKMDMTKVNADLCVTEPAEKGEELPGRVTSRVRHGLVVSEKVHQEIDDMTAKHEAEDLRTDLAPAQFDHGPLQYGLIVPRDGAADHPNGHHHHGHHLENGNGVATARIEKYESADWRKEVVREKLSRLKTAARRAAMGPKSANAEEEVAI